MDSEVPTDGGPEKPRSSQSLVGEYEDLFGDVGRGFAADERCANGRTYRWIRDVLIDVDFETVVAIVKAAKEERSNRKSIIIGFHVEKVSCINTDCGHCGGLGPVSRECNLYTTGHAHVYHECSFSSSTCRCAFNQGYKRLRRRGPFYPLQEASSDYWKNIIEYLCVPRRFLLFSKGGGRTYFQFTGDRIQDLPGSTCLYGLNSSGQVENCDLPGNCSDINQTNEEGDEGKEQNDGVQRARKNVLRSNSVRIRRKQSGLSRNKVNQILGRFEDGDLQVQKTISNQVLELCSNEFRKKIEIAQLLSKQILEYNYTPLSNITRTKEWQETVLVHFNSSRDEFKMAVKSCNIMFMKFTIEDFVEYYESCNKWPRFASIGKPSDLYYDYDYSIKLIEFVIEKQWGNVKVVLQNFYNIFNKVKPKLNTIFIRGDPGSGKNFIMDSFINFFINIGTINTLSKYNLFALQDLVDRRIGIGNDIQISSNELEYVKVLTGGNQATTRVKYEADGVVNRTPLVFMANYEMFNMSDSAWQQRIYYLQTSHIPELERCKKLPYPLAIVGLWEKYRILKSETIFVFEDEF